MFSKELILHGCRTLWNGLKYAKYMMFHPFDGSWCAKHEKRANAGSATVLLAVLVLVTIFAKRSTGYIFNFNDPKEANLFAEIIGVLAPLLLWCIVNWSITTLMDGEGSFRDIYISTAYAMTPVIIFTLVQTVFSWVLTQDGQEIYDLLGAVGVIWTGFLAFVGMMTIQQYTIKKTIFTIIIDIIGMLVVLFLFLLFFALIQQLINFLYVLYTEFSLRL